MLASAGWDRSIRLWDVETGRVVETLNGHRGYVRRVVFTGDGGRLVTASDDRSLKLWDVASGREIRTFYGHAGQVQTVDWSPATGLVASGDGDGMVKLWHTLPMDGLDLRPPYSGLT